jgi:hypothetical protein
LLRRPRLTQGCSAERRRRRRRKVLVNSCFPHAKESLRELSTLWGCALRNVRQPSSRLKKFKECLFEGAPIY